MYLHFEDWTDLTLPQSIENRPGIQEERVIKVIPSDIDPRVALGQTALTIVESSGEVFAANESYAYPQRRTYKGNELEEDLVKYGLNQLAQRSVRSLFRFYNAFGICQAAMAAKSTKQQWLMRHPFHVIDGITQAKNHAQGERLISLDVSFFDSLVKLRRSVYLDNEDTLVDKMDWIQWLTKGTNT